MAKNPHCPFCTKSKDEIIAQNEFAKSFFDTKPANPGHVLVVPKDHVPTIFQCSADQFLAIRDLIIKMKHFLDQNFHPGGYQIGMNCYPIGGQSVMHAHVHIIPRYKEQARRQIFPHDKTAVFPKDSNFYNHEVKDHGITVQEAWPKEFKIMRELKAKGEKVTYMKKYIEGYQK